MLGWLRKLWTRRAEPPPRQTEAAWRLPEPRSVAPAPARGREEPGAGTSEAAGASPSEPTRADPAPAASRSATEPDLPAPARAPYADAPAPQPARAFPRIGLVYCASDAELTRRVVAAARLEATEPGTPPRIVGFCELRGEERRFRADRVWSYFDPDTGEALDEVELGDEAGELRRISRAHPPAPRPGEDAGSEAPATLREALARDGAGLEAMGWTLRLERTFDGHRLSAHRPHKRTGKPLKTASAELAFTPRFYAWRRDESGLYPEFQNPRRQPWSARGNGRYLGSWAEFGPAFAAFLAACREAAPEKPPS